MPTYTVHDPQPPVEDFDERASRLVFVREGFSWLAFLVPVLWLVFYRLWRELLAYLLITVVVVTLVNVAGGSPNAVGWVTFLINLGFGFEARNAYRAALTRKGYELVGVVTGRDLEDAERRFLAEWLPEVKARGARPPAAAQGGAGPLPAMSTGMAHG